MWNVETKDVMNVIKDHILFHKCCFICRDIANAHFFRWCLFFDQVRFEADKLQNQEKVLLDELTATTSEIQRLELELELVKAAADMVFDNRHSVDFHLNQLNEQLQDKRHYILKLETEW